MKKTIFKGAATALITPFKNNEVDYPALEKIINWQIEEGISALVICGTTGEGSTLSDEEHKKVLSFASNITNKRIPLIAGTGSNDTAYAIALTKYAATLGYDASLLVTPYYNKATQKGLIQMYNKIADETKIPAILYNVPSRTGVNIEPKTYKELAENPNIVAIKEANGNLSSVLETKYLVGDSLDIYSGNDDQIIPILSLGGKGVISVLSNVAPKITNEMCNLYFENKVSEAMKLQIEYFDLIKNLFIEVNPIPVKKAMYLMNKCEDEIRMPLSILEDAHTDILKQIMKKHKLI